MKNKLRYILLGVLVSFSFINTVFADEIVISPSVSNVTVAKGSSASIKINLKSSVAIKECLFKFENDSNIDYVSVTGINNWKITETTDGLKITNVSSAITAPVDGQKIAELKYTVNGNGSVVIKTLQCTASDSDDTYTYEDKMVSFIATEPVTEDTTLSSLTVIGGQISPTFSSDAADNVYTIILDSVNFSLEMTASNSKYQDKIVVTDDSGNTISDYGNITFSDPSGQGKMPLTITVNEKTEYKLYAMYKKDDLNNSLKSITINGKELELIDGQLNYKYKVAKDVTVVSVDAILSDSENFQFSSEGNALENGKTTKFNIIDKVDVIIVVEPKVAGAEKKTYTIEITKEGIASSDKDGNVNDNAQTGDISMFVMAFVLISSLVGSIIMYKKNLEGYK